MQPSAISLTYALIAATAFLLWAFRRDMPRAQLSMWWITLGLALAHFVLFYAYQFGSVQSLEPPKSLLARIMGLYPVVSSGPGRMCPPYAPMYVCTFSCLFVPNLLFWICLVRRFCEWGPMRSPLERAWLLQHLRRASFVCLLV